MPPFLTFLNHCHLLRWPLLAAPVKHAILHPRVPANLYTRAEHVHWQVIFLEKCFPLSHVFILHLSRWSTLNLDILKVSNYHIQDELDMAPVNSEPTWSNCGGRMSRG
jgi:hypothetical protein